MKYLSVCSGIEAATVAWHPLGWRPLAFSEIEPFPRAVLAHHYPEVPCHGDFTTISTEYGQPDLLVGGTPCQSFSVAGLRGGLADERGNLALEYLRLAGRLGARWLVYENVPGILSSNGGRDFGSLLGGMVELGYGFAYRVLDAQFFGVPQRRRRVFVVGHLGDWRRAAAVLFERHSLQGHPPPRREAGERVADSSVHCAEIGSTLNAHYGSKWDLEDQHINQGAPLFVTHSLRGEGFDASEDGTGRGTPLVPVAFSAKDHGADAGDLAPTLRAMPHSGSHANGGGQVAIAFGWQTSPSQGDSVSEHVTPSLDKSKTPAVCWQQTMPTLCREPGGPASQDLQQHAAVISGTAVRRLTPRECERLQGFPDDWTLVPHGRPSNAKLDADFLKYLMRGNPKHLSRADVERLAKDGPRYKALGNSMAVPVMRWIGERIAMVERIPAAARAAA